MTSTNAASRNRRRHYEAAIDEAATTRHRLWQVWRWLLAEAKWLTEDGRAVLVADLRAKAAELNERGGR